MADDERRPGRPANPPRTIMGERLRDLRDETGISRLALAKVIGVSQSNIADIERGYRWPGSYTLFCLAEHFDVSLDWLCGRFGVGPKSHL